VKSRMILSLIMVAAISLGGATMWTNTNFNAVAVSSDNVIDLGKVQLTSQGKTGQIVNLDTLFDPSKVSGIFEGQEVVGRKVSIVVAGDYGVNFSVFYAPVITIASDLPKALSTTKLGPEAISIGHVTPDNLSTSIATAEAKSTKDAITGTISIGNITPEAISIGNVTPEAVSIGNVMPEAISTGNVMPGAISMGNVTPEAISMEIVTPQAISIGNILPEKIGSGNLSSETVSTSNVITVNMAAYQNKVKMKFQLQLKKKNTTFEVHVSSTDNSTWIPLSHVQASLNDAITKLNALDIEPGDEVSVIAGIKYTNEGTVDFGRNAYQAVHINGTFAFIATQK
jgi:hypothetical protein